MLEITQFFHYGKSHKGFEFTQFWWRLHRLNVGDYTVFHCGNSRKGFEITQFWRRLHKLNVGDYTIFHCGKSLKGFVITQFLVEITQVECWRLHSFFAMGNPLRVLRLHSFGGDYTS